MTYQEIFKEYSKIPIPNSKWDLFQRFSSAFRRFVLNKRVLYHFSHNTISGRNIIKTDGIIISLTSFPARLDTIWQCIESLKRQSVVPEKIVLYLSKDQISYNDLPSSLIKELDDLFEIYMVEGDIRSHKKYYYAMKEYPDKIIVTTDDDVIYPPFMLSSLLEAHSQYPMDVIANYTHVIKHINGVVAPYVEWYNIPETQSKIDTTQNQIQVGIGGVLYPPNALYKDVLNMELARELAFLADDLWLYTQTIMGGHRVIKSKLNRNTIMPISIKNDKALTSENVYHNKNDVQFKNLRDYYLDRFDIDIVNVVFE